MPSFFSSGDLVADRRAAYAAALAAEGDFAGAADLMAQALELVPHWAAGWCLCGDYAGEAGDRAAAITAYEQLVRLDTEGIFGGMLKLAALGAAAPPPGTESTYVEALFDDYAERFEAELLGRLGYEVPAALDRLIGAALVASGVDRVGHALDLGCGTGLMGERLRARVSYLEGIDLSAGMIAEAGRKGIYDRLEKAELVAHLGAHAGALDLVTAADVLIYCGAIGPIAAAIAARLAPGGLLAFSLETHDGEAPLLLRASLRYAHRRDAALAACRDAGLEIVSAEDAVLRQDRGAPVNGVLVLARKPVPALGALLPPAALDAAEAEMPVN